MGEREVRERERERESHTNEWRTCECGYTIFDCVCVNTVDSERVVEREVRGREKGTWGRER